jgi:hypothetical protein
MNRVIVILASGLSLAGCASGGGTDWFPTFQPKPVDVQFTSQPAGAEARTSTGQACQTPCALAVAPDKDFSVTFALAGYQPQTISVQPTKPDASEGWGETTLQPNPVEVQLAPASRTPAKRTPRKPGAAASATKPAPRPAAVRPATAPQAAPAGVAPAADPWPTVR